MSATGLSVILLFSAALFGLGLFGVLARRGILFQILSVEVMLSGPALAFVAAGAHHGDAGGQGMFILVLALAASEVALGLALYLRIKRSFGDDDSDVVSGLRG
jgi:NADH-quinone oxidoreductase subunit K